MLFRDRANDIKPPGSESSLAAVLVGPGRESEDRWRFDGFRHQEGNKEEKKKGKEGGEEKREKGSKWLKG